MIESAKNFKEKIPEIVPPIKGNGKIPSKENFKSEFLKLKPEAK